jgi:glycosyltransferase involved in cell wall biosynthesis
MQESRGPLKIAHITPAFYPAHTYGGPSESAYQLSAHLARKGLRVRVLTTDANGIDRVLDVPKNVEIELEPRLDVRYSRRRFAHSASPDLLAHLSEYVRWSDVVHLNAVYNFTTLPTLLACRVHGRPLVWSPRGALQGAATRRSRQVKAIWDSACSALVPARTVLHVTSEAEARESAPYFPGVRTEVIPNGVSVPDVLPPRAPSESTLRVGFLGRIHPIKGVETLINAVALARAAEPAITFRVQIAGDGEPGYVAELKALVTSLALDADVEFVGPLTGDSKTRFLVDSDIIVAPSIRENFGMVIAEALAHGTPVIASKGTPWQCLEGADAGYWVTGDARSFAAALTTASRGSLREMGSRGRQLVSEDFSWPRAATRMAEVYEAL